MRPRLGVKGGKGSGEWARLREGEFKRGRMKLWKGKAGTSGIRLIVNSRLNGTNLSVKLVPGPLSALAQGMLFPLWSQQHPLPFPMLKILCELKWHRGKSSPVRHSAPTALPPPGREGPALWLMDILSWLAALGLRWNASKSPYLQMWTSLLCSYCLGLRGSWWTHTCRWPSSRQTRWDTDSHRPWGCTCCSWNLSLLQSSLQWHKQFFCCHSWLTLWVSEKELVIKLGFFLFELKGDRDV